MGNYTTLLFATPTGLEGAASILDFGDTLFDFNSSETADLADVRALNSDWMQISEDLCDSVEIVYHAKCQNHNAAPRQPTR